MARGFNCPVCLNTTVEFPFRSCSGNHAMVKEFTLQGVQGPSLEAARQTASELAVLICELQTTSEFASANQLGASSGQIQALLAPCLHSLGYLSEQRSRQGLAEFRPDFEKTVGDVSILVEIERGKTTDNNMDMLDLWKAHIHPSAGHLVLVVPVWYQTSKHIKRTFHTVCRRMEPFFEPGFATNVKSLHIVGY